MKKLSEPEKRLAMLGVPDWKRQRGALVRCFEFEGFPEAMRFVNAVARASEKAQHHPDIDIRWNRVQLLWVTHDAGGLTQRDFEMAKRCDALAG